MSEIRTSATVSMPWRPLRPLLTATSLDEILEEALAEAHRISGSDADRARALVGIARRTYDIDHARVWEAVTEAMKAANSTSEFTGEDARIQVAFTTKHGSSISSNSEDTFDLHGIFELLAKED